MGAGASVNERNKIEQTRGKLFYKMMLTDYFLNNVVVILHFIACHL